MRPSRLGTDPNRQLYPEAEQGGSRQTEDGCRFCKLTEHMEPYLGIFRPADENEGENHIICIGSFGITQGSATTRRPERKLAHIAMLAEAFALKPKNLARFNSYHSRKWIANKFGTGYWSFGLRLHLAVKDRTLKQILYPVE